MTKAFLDVRSWSATVVIVLGLSTVSSATTITGHATVNCGFVTSCTSFVEFTSDVAIQLVSATFDFSGKDLENRGRNPGDDVNAGVTSYATFPVIPPFTKVFGFTATGFDSGDSLDLGWSLVRPSALPFITPPTGAGMDGGILHLVFSDSTAFDATFAGPTVFVNNVRANFTFVGPSPNAVPEPGTLFLVGSSLWFARRKLLKN